MKVRRLEINGFKSFADKSILDVPEKLLAVVGPNGCGKSNVVDAVRWVLGEQSAKQLRGHNMEDVLFNGSDARKPQGMAEVSLVFENNDNLAHAQFSGLAEISVTRRLYRSGESEYLINKMPCRLKDIQQLIMDTGLGNRAYAIIEQGGVSAFIEAKPTDRRLWLEEAAGITRYKNQKKVSERKLAASQDNMDRLQDIILEVESQMAKLKRQAKKAQRFSELGDRIRKLDLNIASFEYSRLSDELTDVRAESEAVGAQLLLANQRVTRLETDQETLKVRLVAAEQEIGQAGQRRLDIQGEMQRAENELTLIGQKAENTRQLQDRYQQEQTGLKESLAQKQKELERARRVGATAAERKDQSQAEAQKASQHLADCQRSLGELEEKADTAKQAVVDHLSQTSQTNNRLADLDHYQADIARRRQNLEIKTGKLEQEVAELSATQEKAQAELTELKQEATARAERLAGFKTRREELKRELTEARRRQEEASLKLHKLSASVEALEQSLSSHEWAPEGVRQALASAKNGKTGAEVLGVVGDFLEVEPGSEAVVETALGPYLQAMVVEDGQAAQALGAWARDAGLGKLLVLALADLRTQAEHAPAASQALAGLARPKAGFESLSALLAGAGVAPDLASAWPAGKELAPGQMLVTANGERLDRPGTAWVGKGATASPLARQAELNQKREEKERAGREEESAASQRARLQEDFSSLEAEIASQRQAQEEAQGAFAQAEREIFRLGESLASKRRELEGLAYDAGQAEADMERLTHQRFELESKLADLEETREGREAQLEQVRQALASGREAVEEARRKEGETRLTLSDLANQAGRAQDEVRRLTTEVAGAERRLTELAGLVETSSRQMLDLAARKEEVQNRLGDLLSEMDRREEAVQKAQATHQKAREEAADLDAALKQARQEQREVEENSRELEFKRREIKLAQESLCERTMETCRVDLTTDFASYLPQKAFDPESSRESLAKLRTRLNRLGPVNLEAISEHEALSERHQFLTSQKEDLEASLADLKLAIRKINKTSRARFRETLEAVNQKLGEVYPLLFPGGQALLITDEGVDPLEAGLHLMVELPGKKVKNLEALSGGEKALSAVAVLFALYLIRPAPFCILDEVDAPLDEANVTRFHELLGRLSERSQIIMITHNRRTMEIMDLLYGVTMEEKGVSKLLSVNLSQGESMAA